VVETVASVVLGVAMLVAGGAKLASRTWPADARGLGAPGWSVPVVPWVELVLGALLVVGVLRPLVAIATALLLIAFTVLLSARLARGERPPCACFGRLSTRPISWWSVVRNLVLVGLAVAVVVSSA
jgi:uncharacterized membrane protein YphA (DoxX/SURF4 family)